MKLVYQKLKLVPIANPMTMGQQADRKNWFLFNTDSHRNPAQSGMEIPSCVKLQKIPISNISMYPRLKSFWLTRLYCPMKKGTMHCEPSSMMVFLSHDCRLEAPGKKISTKMAVKRIDSIWFPMSMSLADKKINSVNKKAESVMAARISDGLVPAHGRKDKRYRRMQKMHIYVKTFWQLIVQRYEKKPRYLLRPYKKGGVKGY